MVGTIAFFDKTGERQHTTYTAATPEYGKERFLDRFEQEIEKVKALYPKVDYAGLADGAKCNWLFLEKHTGTQTLDFWHVTEYLGKAANVMYRGKRKEAEKAAWLDQSCHKLKHSIGSATRLLNEMLTYHEEHDMPQEQRNTLESVITYFTNNKSKMKYAQNMKKHLPIGSGVTEAACKVIVKQRLCGSAMKWKDTGAAAVLSLRCINYSKGRWSQFWQKVNQYGAYGRLNDTYHLGHTLYASKSPTKVIRTQGNHLFISLYTAARCRVFKVSRKKSTLYLKAIRLDYQLLNCVCISNIKIFVLKSRLLISESRPICL